MARKGYNIYRRKDGRWEGRYIKGRRPDGSRIYGFIYGKKFDEVKTKLIPLKAIYAAHEKRVQPDFKGLFRDWLAFWLEEVVKPDIKPSTYAGYHNKIHNHILPAFGGKPIDKLSQGDIQQFVDGLTDKGLSANSVRAVFRILNAALSNAAESNIIFLNPCKDVKQPKAEKVKTEALPLGHQKALEQAALYDKHGTEVILALYTGMRIGEICALMWEDIDFDSGLIYVRRTVERIPSYDNSGVKTKILFGTPKTTNSSRIIPLPRHLMAYLSAVREISGGPYVVSCKGSFAEPRVVRYRFRRFLKSAGLPPIRFHSLRHTFATRCIERNIDITTLSRLLGHSSSKLTLDIYTDSVLEQKKKAMSVMDMLFEGGAADKKDSSEYKKAAIIQALTVILDGSFQAAAAR